MFREKSKAERLTKGRYEVTEWRKEGGKEGKVKEQKV